VVWGGVHVCVCVCVCVCVWVWVCVCVLICRGQPLKRRGQPLQVGGHCLIRPIAMAALGVSRMDEAAAAASASDRTCAFTTAGQDPPCRGEPQAAAAAAARWGPLPATRRAAVAPTRAPPPQRTPGSAVAIHTSHPYHSSTPGAPPPQRTRAARRHTRRAPPPHKRVSPVPQQHERRAGRHADDGQQQAYAEQVEDQQNVPGDAQRPGDLVGAQEEGVHLGGCV
jgi:hypothetical protein